MAQLSPLSVTLPENGILRTGRVDNSCKETNRNRHHYGIIYFHDLREDNDARLSVSFADGRPAGKNSFRRRNPHRAKGIFLSLLLPGKGGETTMLNKLFPRFLPMMTARLKLATPTAMPVKREAPLPSKIRSCMEPLSLLHF